MIEWIHSNYGKPEAKMEKVSETLAYVNGCILDNKINTPRNGKLVFKGEGLAAADRRNLEERGMSVDSHFVRHNGGEVEQTTVKYR